MTTWYTLIFVNLSSNTGACQSHVRAGAGQVFTDCTQDFQACNVHCSPNHRKFCTATCLYVMFFCESCLPPFSESENPFDCSQWTNRREGEHPRTRLIACMCTFVVSCGRACVHMVCVCVCVCTCVLEH